MQACGVNPGMAPEWLDKYIVPAPSIGCVRRWMRRVPQGLIMHSCTVLAKDFQVVEVRLVARGMVGYECERPVLRYGDPLGI